MDNLPTAPPELIGSLIIIAGYITAWIIREFRRKHEASIEQQAKPGDTKPDDDDAHEVILVLREMLHILKQRDEERAREFERLSERLLLMRDELDDCERQLGRGRRRAKQGNRKARNAEIVRLLKQPEPLSKAEIARRAGVHVSTVRRIAKRLEAGSI